MPYLAGSLSSFAKLLLFRIALGSRPHYYTNNKMKIDVALFQSWVEDHASASVISVRRRWRTRPIVNRQASRWWPNLWIEDIEKRSIIMYCCIWDLTTWPPLERSWPQVFIKMPSCWCLLHFVASMLWPGYRKAPFYLYVCRHISYILPALQLCKSLNLRGKN